MKKLLSLLLIVPQLAFSQYLSKSFTLDNTKELKKLLFEQSILENKEFPISINTEITGLAISGKALLENDNDSFIRVLLKDKYNYEYLVYENYPMLSENLTSEFDNVAIETLLLDKINPQSIRIEVHNASLELDTLKYILASAESRKVSNANMSSIQKAQNQYIADKLNENLKSHNMPWRAGVSSVSSMSYEEKKLLFGGTLPELYGFDYYKRGYFVLPGNSSPATASAKNRDAIYVSEWDWRNRHGKNWMTSVHDQDTCGSCWAFASVGALEAYINLYYNRTINYDLSEEELISCTTKGCGGGILDTAFVYVRDHGIVLEDCFPYIADSLDCNTAKCQNPTEIVNLSSYQKVGFLSISEESLKQQLFKSPVALGLFVWRHGMTVAGFKTVEIGDEVTLASLFGESDIVVDSTYLGETAWLVKNSWGDDWGDGGYAYIITTLALSYFAYPDGRINCIHYDDTDIVCEDTDGDGYYFWGVGDKPEYCPSWVPDIEDGNDNDSTKGKLFLSCPQIIGSLENLHPIETLNIFGNVVYNTRESLYSHINIAPNASLTVSNILNLFGQVNISIPSGGTLIIDGGVITNANINIASGGKIVITNGGKLVMRTGTDFYAPVGALVNITNGEILRFNDF